MHTFKHHAVGLICALAVSSFAVACGGPSKNLTGPAAGAPPPPDGKSRKLDRNVSRATEKQFAEAVAYFQEQKKAGWSDQGCQESARRFLEIAEEGDKVIEARYNAGLSYQSCGMLEAAEEQYQTALKVNPGHAPSLSNLGQIYFIGGNEARAKQYWSRAVEADGKIVAARNNLAWLLIREIRASKGAKLKSLEEEVKRHLSSALAVDNDNVEAYVLYSLLYMQGSERNESRLTLARLLLEKGEKLDPKFAPLHNARGLLLLRQDNVPRALASFRQAVELDPKFVEARMNVGNIVLDFRKYGEAKAEFSAVLELDPKNYDALIGLGYAQRGLEDLAAAEQSYEQARKLDSSRPEAYFNLGVLYKDFKANTVQGQDAQKVYRQAALYFKQAQAKADGKLQREAKQNIEDCEQNIKSIEEFLKFQQQNKAG